MVASSQPLATQAGLSILAAGGNAADAAVATAAALNVTEPTSTGLGGDVFVLYYDSASRQITALNGSGRTPMALSLERLSNEGFGVGPGEVPLPDFHPHTVTVPGAAAAWCDLIDRHGSLALSRIFAPAIQLAEEGFPVAPLTAVHWKRGAERQLRHQPGGAQLMIEGRAPREGEIMRNPALGRVLRALAEEGKHVYYEGWIAERIVDVLTAQGSVMASDDLAQHHSEWVEPISVPYGAWRVHECPPNGQGLVALIALNILAEFDLPRDPLSVERLHLLIEALRLAFADAAHYVADPAHQPAPLDELLSRSYATGRAGLIDPHKATLTHGPGVPAAGADTVYFCTVDSAGNACSFINSNYMGFGTGIVPEGCGFSLQNRGRGFSLDPAHPNALAPDKRPYHTIIPGLLTRESDGALVGPFGVMGGFMQPQGHVQVVLGLVDDGLDPQAVLDRPRICIEDGTASGRVALEDGIPVQVMAGLAELGHTVRPVSGHGRALFGRGQIILRDSTTGVLCGGSDPRADGCAQGI